MLEGLETYFIESSIDFTASDPMTIFSFQVAVVRVLYFNMVRLGLCWYTPD